jgi:DNA-binding XRE family transcriptional regulator
MTRVANRLREVLADRRVTQTDLALLAGLPYTAVLRIARTAADPPLGYALRIGAVLDATVEDLFWIEGRDEGGGA